MSRIQSRLAFTLVEVLVVIACIGVLIGLLLPATRGSREAARRMSCGNNIKQIGLAMHNYHAAYNHFPAMLNGTDGCDDERRCNMGRLSAFVPLAPFIVSSDLGNALVILMALNFPPWGQLLGLKLISRGPSRWAFIVAHRTRLKASHMVSSITPFVSATWLAIFIRQALDAARFLEG